MKFKTSLHRRRIVAKAIQKRRAKLKELGLCPDCGHEKPLEGRALGPTCLNYRRRKPTGATPMDEPCRRLVFTIPLTPPSVNHYTQHITVRGKTMHLKSAEAKAWERDFPLFSRQQYVVSDIKRFGVTLEIYLAPGERGDIDNFPKCVLDCIAKAWMLRDKNLGVLSDATIKELTLRINDSEVHRAQGPLTRITIEAL